ncbi:response regulator transcription factor [Hymenobacter sp. BRD128]|uniref:response regulator transcription factor n=1 Tax=Hymenobacter sp. BRD128 TaxID=2675878 RepID=UPI001564AB52|nr:response regulator transcription factor [Hymenobacter sp. BRD128]QKG58453.1 response regulator transcription factor [Hymenobacter sp. BRD128]
MKLLLVEDEVVVTHFIQKGIEAEGYDLRVAYDGLMGQAMFDQQPFDVVILDVNLPGLNGFELCRYIKQHSPRQPVLLLTALDGLQDKENGFGAGADDYLVKPFAFRELLLRIRALARRGEAYAGLRHVLRVADLELDINARTVRRAGQPIELTTREYSLLEYLMTNQNRTVSRVDIAEKVWNLNFDTNTNIIDVYVNYLRNKIDKPFGHKLLHTIVGTGYMMRG